MNISVQNEPKSLVKIAVEITPAEMSGYFDQAARQVAGSISVPGFRRGKAPRSVIAQRVGADYLTAQVLELAVQDSYYQAVTTHDLKPISQPTTDLTGEPADLETDGLTYTATVPVLPEVTLGDYQSVKVTPNVSTYTDTLVEETLEQLRRSKAENVAVDRPATKGDRVEIDYVGTLKGSEFPGGKSENHPLVLGEDNFIPGFADNLVKLSKGAVKKFKLKFPKDYHEETLAGQKVEFTVTMKRVEEVRLPELSDAFAKEFGGNSLADLQKLLTTNLKQEKEEEARRETEQAVIDAVLEEAEVDVPDIIVAEEQQKMLAEFRQNVEHQGLPYEKYLEHLGKSEEEIIEEARPEAVKRATLSLVLNAIQRAEKVKVTDKEVEAELDRQLAFAPDPDTIERVKSDDFRVYVANILRNRAVIAKLVKTATA